MSTTVRERYAAFDDHRLAPFVKGAVGFGVLASLPYVLPATPLGDVLSVKILILTLVFAYSAQAWNIMSGFTGQFSFGHAAFFGIGAYTTQKLLIDVSMNPWLTMLVGGVLAAAYGLVIGFLAFRYDLEGHYFALATLAFAELLRFTVKNMRELNGANGYFKPFPADYGAEYGLAAFQFQGDLPYYYVIVALLALVTTVAWLVKHSWVGLYFFAIREDERAAASVGVPAFRYKMLGIAISAFFTAWAGTFWSMYFNTIQPGTVFDLFKNVELLLPAVVGGPGTIVGPIVGSFLVTPVSEVARTLFDDVNGLAQAIYGVFLVLIVIYSPGGAVEWPDRFRNLVRSLRGEETDDTTRHPTTEET